jgi:hypothetical protein
MEPEDTMRLIGVGLTGCGKTFDSPGWGVLTWAEAPCGEFFRGWHGLARWSGSPSGAKAEFIAKHVRTA